MKIDPAEYPSSKEWDEKVFSTPNLPRGDVGAIDILRNILLEVKEGRANDQKLIFSGSSSSITLDEACVRIRPMHLVQKTENGWSLSEESLIWLNSGDNLFLAAFLCANVKFLAEILYYLDEPKTAA